MGSPVPFNKKRLVDLCHKTSHLHHGISTTLGMKGDEYAWLLGVFFWMRKPAKSPPLAKLVAFQAFSDVRKQSQLVTSGSMVASSLQGSMTYYNIYPRNDANLW